MSQSASKVQEFLAALSSCPGSLLILPHDNPDPDSLASAAGLRFLIRRKLGRTPIIGLSGIIGRAENHALVSTLAIPLVPAKKIFPGFRGSVILVDTQPNRRNNVLPTEIIPVAVIDHHPDWGQSQTVPFVDLREQYGATSTIVASYLQEAKLKMSSKVSTALFYAITSETKYFGPEAARADISTSRFLYPLINHRLLSEIEHPLLSRDYFILLSEALKTSIISQDVVVTVLESVPYPDAVAEIADFLLRLKTVSWSICLARYGHMVHISVRSKDPQAHAGRLLSSILPGGQAGGHGTSAGGRFQTSETKWEGDASKVVRNFLHALAKAPSSKGEPLLSK